MLCLGRRRGIWLFRGWQWEDWFWCGWNLGMSSCFVCEKNVVSRNFALFAYIRRKVCVFTIHRRLEEHEVMFCPEL
jgi:hypothetical protein